MLRRRCSRPAAGPNARACGLSRLVVAPQSGFILSSEPDRPGSSGAKVYKQWQPPPEKALVDWVAAEVLEANGFLCHPPTRDQHPGHPPHERAIAYPRAQFDGNVIGHWTSAPPVTLCQVAECGPELDCWLGRRQAGLPGRSYRTAEVVGSSPAAPGLCDSSIFRSL
jgi:hypothetical protein